MQAIDCHSLTRSTFTSEGSPDAEADLMADVDVAMASQAESCSVVASQLTIVNS
ncbi:hypothetical protein ACSF6K_00660 [Escherichia coli]|uniref:hypothetical protein n=1 Tax=Escherichia coli TaxID=562 RepID=UPI003EECB60C